MGEIKSEWCFSGWAGRASRQYCTRARVDTGSGLTVIPQKEARRLGVRYATMRRQAPDLPEFDAPRDAQGNVIPGDYYVVGSMSSDAHGCEVSPVIVFGQKDASESLIGHRALQSVGANIRLALGDDRMRCGPARPQPRDLGAAASFLRALLVQAPGKKERF